ncbi:hypothetical protein [Allocoleopsis sp.]|uniref:hypothetical protein n=1 Tax=Allocoleopsis sp. TaxID=3088169 RepID=UPI002FD3FC8D
MSNLQKMDDLLNNLEFENDFGESPILLGRLTQDKAFITVASLGLGFAAWAIAQAPLAIVVGLIAWNDLVSLGEGKTKTKKTPPVVDTQAETVYNDEEREGYEYEEEVPVRHSQKPPRQEETKVQSKSSRTTRQEPPEAVYPPKETEDEQSTGWTFYGDRQPTGDEDMLRQRSPRTTKSESKQQSGFTPQLPQVTNRAKRDLIDKLKGECPGMLRLVKSHPARLVGKQRTGKSTMAKLMCLLRMVLIDDHRVIASTPHYEPANPYPDVFKVVGVTPTGQRDYDAIYREWRGLADRVHACRINSNTTVWDEFGLFDQVMPEDEIKSVLTSCLRETMKFGEYPIFIVHGETAAFLPGSKGLVTVFLNGTVRVETIGELVEDEDGLETIRPTGKFHITWLDGSQEEGQIPEWLTEKYLLDLLGNPVVTHSESEPEEECRLQEPLKTIYLYAKKQNEWVTVREVQRKDFTVLKGKGAKNIRQYFGLLADTGLGEIEEEGKSDSAVSFLAK